MNLLLEHVTTLANPAQYAIRIRDNDFSHDSYRPYGKHWQKMKNNYFRKK
jgi:hypothetical protein